MHANLNPLASGSLQPEVLNTLVAEGAAGLERLLEAATDELENSSELYDQCVSLCPRFGLEGLNFLIKMGRDGTTLYDFSTAYRGLSAFIEHISAGSADPSEQVLFAKYEALLQGEDVKAFIERLLNLGPSRVTEMGFSLQAQLERL
jgi:hypothetical protein